jgi:hypothetical protein
LVVRGKGGETRDEPDDDLRVRADCFNRRIWLDESASEKWGTRTGFCSGFPRWQVAGGVERGARSEEMRGVVAGKGPLCGDPTPVSLGTEYLRAASIHDVAVNSGRARALLQPSPRV